jgi:hypothetical protein
MRTNAHLLDCSRPSMTISYRPSLADPAGRISNDDDSSSTELSALCPHDCSRNRL